jgi:putative transposase
MLRIQSSRRPSHPGRPPPPIARADRAWAPPACRRYPFILVDALFIKSREDDRVVHRAALVVSGIRADGHREILGVKIGDTENFATWDETFRWLKSRGLKGVVFVISDSHGGLTQAIAKHFQGASWQRCQVHLMRNLLAYSPVKHRSEVAAGAKLVLQAQDLVEAKRRLAEFAERFGKSAAKAVACLEEGFEDAMAVMALPDKYRRRTRTTNMQERLNEEIRRRERVIRIFPNDDSALRLIGALLAEQNETWQNAVTSTWMNSRNGPLHVPPPAMGTTLSLLPVKNH